MTISGYHADVPVLWPASTSACNCAEIFHGVVGMLFVAAMFGHIYIGTIGMEGAFDAMGDGTVDLNWAKEHHSLWLEEEMGRGPRRGRAAPAAGRIAAAYQIRKSDARPRGRAFCYKGAMTGPIPHPCALSVSPAGAARAKPR